MEDITIEKMKHKDLFEVSKVFMKVFNQVGEHWTFEIAQKHVETNFFGDCHFVARANGKIIGMIMGIPLIFERGNSLFVDAIAVLPDHQKNGVGSLLWNRMEQYAAENNFNAIRLLTHPKLESFNWYKEMGYQTSGWVEMYKKVD